MYRSAQPMSLLQSRLKLIAVVLVLRQQRTVPPTRQILLQPAIALGIDVA